MPLDPRKQVLHKRVTVRIAEHSKEPFYCNCIRESDGCYDAPPGMLAR